MLFFKPKRVDPENVHVETPKEEGESSPGANTNSGGGQFTVEFTKINAQIDSFKEMRKGMSEQISQIREQIGELRGQIVNTDKSVSQIEVKTTKAVDLVESVQPDKMMITLQKQDSKIEALKANIDSNETMMKTLMAEMKEIRLKMGLFKGVEQLNKMLEDAKAMLASIQKLDANIARHADKVESIYAEFQKSFGDFRSLTDDYKNLTKQFKDIQTSFDQTKVKVDGAAAKKELEGLINKFNDFEKRVSGIVELLDKHANDLPIYLEDKFKKWEERVDHRFDHYKKIKESVEKFEKDFPKVSAELKMPPPTEEQPIPAIPAELPKLGEKGPGDKPGLLSGILKPKEEKKPEGKA